MNSGNGTYLANRLLDLVAGTIGFVPATTLYIALYSVMPGPDGGGTELSGGGYARLAVSNDLVAWTAASHGAKTNAIPFVFSGATADLGVVVGAALWDAPTDGNLYIYMTFDEARSIFNGDTPQFPAGTFILKGL